MARRADLLARTPERGGYVDRGRTELGPEARELARLAREYLGAPSEEVSEERLRIVQMRVARHHADTKNRGRRRVAWLAAAAMIALALSVAGGRIAHWRGSEPALTYRTEGTPAGEDGYVRTPPGVASKVVFSDGSLVELSGGSRIRVASVDAHGARVGLEEGTIHVNVMHRQITRWNFDAGPFQVLVKGTRFDLVWSGAAGRLDVRLSHGLLAVKGPLSEEPIALRSGQRLTVLLAEKQVILGELPPSAGGGELDPITTASGASAGTEPTGDAPSAEASAQEPAGQSGPSQGALVGDAPVGGAFEGGALTGDAGLKGALTGEAAYGAEPIADEPSGRAPTTRHTAVPMVNGPVDAPPSAHPRQAGRREATGTAPSRSASWATYLAEGRLQDVLDEAQRRGLEAAMNDCTSEELAVLADAARYKGHSDIAERALLKQRARFAGSIRARDAAFLLGRLYEARGTSGLAGALAWYDRYLAEAPSGSYAPEALGRKMTATERLSGADVARPVALLYLDRYPTGAYARAARALARSP